MDKDEKMLLKAIRAYCLECMLTAKDVEACLLKGCPLHPFRNGKAPAQEDMQTKAEGGKAHGCKICHSA